MKKIISLILVLSMALCLAACGDTTETTTQPAVSNEPGYTITINGTEIEMNVNAADIIAALGEPKSYTEEASCAFEGLDKTYFYGSFYLTTYPDGDNDFTYSLWLVDDTITTAEGAYIGMTEEAMQAIYGTDGYNGSNAYVMTKGDCKLTVIVDGGVVTSIQYDAVVE